MTTVDDELRDHVVGIAKRLEAQDGLVDRESAYLELKAEVTLQSDGWHPTAFVYVLEVGGPHVELHVSGSEVMTLTGWWGGNKHATHVRNEAMAEQSWQHAYETWEASR